MLTEPEEVRLYDVQKKGEPRDTGLPQTYQITLTAEVCVGGRRLPVPVQISILMFHFRGAWHLALPRQSVLCRYGQLMTQGWEAITAAVR